MKTKLVILIATGLFVAGCLTTTAPVQTVQPQRLDIFVNGAQVKSDEMVIQHTMSISNPHLELSSNCKILDGIAYMTITSSYAWGAKDIWSDFKWLQAAEIKELVIYLYNPGGEASAGFAIADELRIMKGSIKLTIEARGEVASAGIPILVVGDHRIASRHIRFMVHPAGIWKGGGWTKEGLTDLISQSEMIKMGQNHYAEIISFHTKLSKEEVLELLKKTTWFTAEEALTMGFIDEIR